MRPPLHSVALPTSTVSVRHSTFLAAATLFALCLALAGLPSPAGSNNARLEQDAYLGGPASEVLAFQQG